MKCRKTLRSEVPSNLSSSAVGSMFEIFHLPDDGHHLFMNLGGNFEISYRGHQNNVREADFVPASLVVVSQDRPPSFQG